MNSAVIKYSVCGLLCSGLIPAAEAATNEEMTRLEAAYPLGSVVICRQDLPGDGMARLPTRLEVCGTVLSRKADLATGQGIATWTTRSSDTPALTLTFAGTQRKSGWSGYYSRIDPDSMVVSMPVAGPEGEKTVLEGMCQRLPAGEEFAPISQKEITDSPSYVVRKPDDTPSYCHKKAGMTISFPSLYPQASATQLPVAIDYPAALALRQMAAQHDEEYPQYLLAPEVSALLHYVPVLHRKMLFTTLWNTGAHINQALALTRGDFYLTPPYPYVQSSVVKKPYAALPARLPV